MIKTFYWAHGHPRSRKEYLKYKLVVWRIKLDYSTTPPTSIEEPGYDLAPAPALPHFKEPWVIWKGCIWCAESGRWKVFQP